MNIPIVVPGLSIGVPIPLYFIYGQIPIEVWIAIAVAVPLSIIFSFRVCKRRGNTVVCFSFFRKLRIPTEQCSLRFHVDKTAIVHRILWLLFVLSDPILGSRTDVYSGMTMKKAYIMNTATKQKFPLTSVSHPRGEKKFVELISHSLGLPLSVVE